MLKRLRQIFFNPYFLTMLGFTVWMTFFDRYSYMNLREINQKMSDSKAELEWYTTELDQVRRDHQQLNSSLEEKERFAREHFYMKASNEVIFLTE
tara:strand:+ start:2488 stop:2772 length:285 start_codon:yes stop_codon:yes gene_type:complete